jgi:hypothetical protein
MQKSIGVENLKQKDLSQVDFYELLRTFIRNVGKLSKDVSDKESMMKPQKTFDELQKGLQEDNIRRDAYFKTPSKGGTLKILEKEDTTSEDSRYLDQEIANLSLVTNYNNRFAKELSKDYPSSNRRDQTSGAQNHATTEKQSGNTTANPCFDFIRGRCQQGSACQYSHKTADCQRKVEEDYVRAVSSAFLSEKAKKTVDWAKFDELKQEIHRNSASLKMVSDNEGMMIDGKFSDVVETPSQTNPIYQSPGSVSSKYIRFQEEQLKEFSEEEN